MTVSVPKCHEISNITSKTIRLIADKPFLSKIELKSAKELLKKVRKSRISQKTVVLRISPRKGSNY